MTNWFKKKKKATVQNRCDLNLCFFKRLMPPSGRKAFSHHLTIQSNGLPPSLRLHQRRIEVTDGQLEICVPSSHHSAPLAELPSSLSLWWKAQGLTNQVKFQEIQDLISTQLFLLPVFSQGPNSSPDEHKLFDLPIHTREQWTYQNSLPLSTHLTGDSPRTLTKRWEGHR